ncbi:hypothetical protein ACLGIH_02580 [Streptomyces sp. HMX87]|uniref:hypothetical protein n=1 Tax=Streptomyces sp. HMX87 TaxID=3390849 RepID=UPI003A8993FF
MGTHPMRAAVVLGAATALAASLGTASAAPPAEHSGGRQAPEPVLVDCTWRPEVRPEAFLIACGDGNSRLESLDWSRWDRHAAVARGVNLVNDCEPYCAAGTFHAYPVTVRLDRPGTWEKDPDERHWTRMTLTYTDGRPDGFPRTVTYPLWD